MASLPSAERHGSWGAASYSQTRCLLAPKTDTIDCEAQPYEIGNRALSHLDADGVFYIRGVRYTMVSKDEGGTLEVVHMVKYGLQNEMLTHQCMIYDFTKETWFLSS